MAAEVHCSNCGHRNALGANFCSSCGAILETQQPDNTTMTFHPTEPVDPVSGDDTFPAVAGPAGDEVAVLVITRGGAAGSRFALTQPVTTAGRHPDSEIFLDDVTVSRRHAEVVMDDQGYVARDVGSLNGTYLNRERIEEARLANGDELQIGKFKLLFFLGSPDAP